MAAPCVFRRASTNMATKSLPKPLKNNLDPQAYVDQMHGNFKTPISALNVEVTDFIRTTDGHHKGAVQYIWQELAKKDLIYKGTYEGWYCTGCGKFCHRQRSRRQQRYLPRAPKTIRALERRKLLFQSESIFD